MSKSKEPKTIVDAASVDHVVMPRRVQRKRVKGWRLPDNTVCVTRPGPWGNPYKSANTFRIALQIAIEDGEYYDACDEFAERSIRWIAENIEDLRGANLACWCEEGRECHADTLLRFANQSA